MTENEQRIVDACKTEEKRVKDLLEQAWIENEGLKRENNALWNLLNVLFERRYEP